MGTYHVVIVDDNDLSLKLLSGLAREIPDVIVHPFPSSADALAWSGKQHVDCFILDYQMPSPNGVEMIKLLREIPAFALVPIVIVTGEEKLNIRYRALDAGANDFLQKPIDRREFIARVTTHLSLQDAHERLALRIGDLENTVRDESDRASAHAARLEALWQIANNPALDDEQLLQAMLQQGASAVQPGLICCGLLATVDGTEVVTEATYFDESSQEAAGPLRPGVRTRLEESAIMEVIRTGITRSWDDIQADPLAARRKRVTQLRWRSMIITPLRAAGATYYLCFVSTSAAVKPFGKEDHAYVELLGSLFATHLQSRWQWRRIRYQSEHDALTGLRNRGQFRSEGRMAFAETRASALAIVNVDHFRNVNETYGTIIGDAILVEVGAALAERAQSGELVGRLDGDSFGIFIPAAQKETLERRIADYAGTFDRPFSTGDREGKETVGVTATIGVATAPEDGTTFDELLARADAATSAAKAEFRGRITFFKPGMEGREQQRTRLTNALVEALSRDEFVLHFQPHVDLATMRVTGAEALIRWNHPTRGLLLPAEFIPFAERYGLIKGIGSWVMERAIDAARAICLSEPTFRLLFNLSAVQLEDMELIERFISAANAGVSLQNLGVELTETSAMRDVKATLRFTSVLREHGVHIAIDDFGIGYSSLALLKTFPVDVVKIDRTFVAALLEDSRDAAIAEAVVWLGSQLGYTTIAEGVEKPEQLDWLRSHGCHHAQGYAICRPVPLQEFRDWLASGSVPNQ
jgi:diguanylate cyclase (GGDEF)-like protein